MIKLGEYFDRSSHLVLQDEVLFNLIFYFGLRGRENLRALKKGTFEVEVEIRFLEIKFVEQKRESIF